jgi:hypothetical protein
VVSRVFTCWKGATGSYVGAAGSVARVEAVDVASDVAEGEIAELDAGVVWSGGAASVSLVDVRLFMVSNRYRWIFDPKSGLPG